MMTIILVLGGVFLVVMLVESVRKPKRLSLDLGARQDAKKGDKAE
jgi:hypothetical protein